MAQYYFVAAALPSLSLEEKPDITVAELKELFALNLSRTDLQKVDSLLTLIDLHNLRSFWAERAFDLRGNFSEKELEEALLVKEGLPEFVLQYLEQYESNLDRLRYFPSLYVSLYSEMEQEMQGFLKRYYAFEREVRLVLTAIRAKRYGRDLIRELQFEDPTDPFVASILAQKDGSEYTPPPEYIQLLGFFSDKPMEQQKAFLTFSLQSIEEMEGEEPFSMDHLLGYMARLIRIESWHATNRELGLSLIEELSKYG